MFYAQSSIELLCTINHYYHGTSRGLEKNV